MNRNFNKLHLAMIVALFSTPAFAADPPASCPEGTVTCNTSSQHMGDTSSSADNTETQSSNSGTSSADNNTGYAVTAGENNLQQSGNAVTQSPEITSSIAGGNTQSQATGGTSSATGNKLDSNNVNEGNKLTNDNRSSVGNTTANTGDSYAGIGDTSSNSGGNKLTNGSNTATNTANGGAGGQGGAGGKGGSISGDVGSTSGVDAVLGNTQGQGQGQSSDNWNGNANNLGQGQSSDNTNTLGNSQGQSSDNWNGQGQSSTNSLGQGQSSENSQGQSSSTNTSTAQGQNSDNRNANNTGGNRMSTSTDTSNDHSGNSRVEVDSSSRYYNKTMFIPAIILPTAPSVTAAGNIIKETLACGPIMQVVKTPVTGSYHGLFRTRDVAQGFTYDIAPVADANGHLVTYNEVPLSDGSVRLMGHQPVIFTTVVTVAGGRNLALGGGSGNGDWGQAGLGSSGSNNRLVTNIQLVPCEIGTLKREVQYIEVPVRKGRE